MTQAQGNLQDRNARTARGLAVSRVWAGKRFGGYKPEQEKAVRRVDVKEDEALRKLKEAWGAFKYHSVFDMMTHYSEVRDFLEAKDLTYSSGDVERFSIALAEFQDEEWFSHKAGLFLSALINNGEDDDYTIHTAHLSESITDMGFKVGGIRNLGCKNRKNITVEGNVGEFVGCGMVSGTIVVKGNADEYVGSEMEGGTIVVEGDADESVGDCMKGGKIRVKGNVRDDVGSGMEGGTIIIEGDVRGDVGHNMNGGTIIIEGNAKAVVGFGMKNGEIRVKGDAGQAVGNEMDGGKIIIEGNADEYVGLSMEGGEIHIEGSADDNVGLSMEGGEIHIEGSYGSIGTNIEGGKIYHKGKLIVDK